MERLNRGAHAAMALGHPNIIEVYAVGITTDGRPYIAMKYAAGRSLRQKVARISKSGAPFPVSESLTLIKQIAEALSVAHATGIIHRDVRPSNILFRHDGMPMNDYVIDVGCGSGRLARPLSEYLRGKYLGIDVVPRLID